MRYGFFLALALAVAFATPERARAQPGPSPEFNWTGFYLGVSGGGGFGSTRHTNAGNGINSGTNSDLTGGIVGGTYGFNWLLDPAWLIGVEGDISWSPFEDKFVDHNGSGFCEGAAKCVTNLHWLGTDRLRLGYRTGDDWLFFATGGVAYGDVKATITDGCCGVGTVSRVGYTAGGGVETSIAPRVSLKLEYLFVDLGNKINYPGEKVSVRANVLRMGLNYQLGAP